jgi:translation initiation factor IF-3
LGPPVQHRQRLPYDPGAPLRDEDIGVDFVQIVNADGSLGQPLSLGVALLSFDREQNFLVKAADSTADRFTVCRVVSKAEYREQQRSRGKPAKGSNALKQVELNWAIDQHDLSHRLNQMESFLNKGKRVQLTLVRKPKKRLATMSEAESLLETVKQWIKDVEAIQTKPMNGKPSHHVEFFLEKPRKS